MPTTDPTSGGSFVPTPGESARAALASGARDMARDALMRRIYSFLRDKLPRPVYDFLFRGKSAGELAEAELHRRLRSLLWGCGFTLVFGVLVGGVLVFVAAVVAVALVGVL